jgi:hypothetical protein
MQIIKKYLLSDLRVLNFSHEAKHSKQTACWKGKSVKILLFDV